MTRDSTRLFTPRDHCARSIACGAESLLGESTLAASTRTRLTRDRLKSVLEGDAVAIGAVPPHSNRPEGQATTSFRRRTRLMTASPRARCSPRRRRLAYG
jgi:hypothetical protein